MRKKTKMKKKLKHIEMIKKILLKNELNKYIINKK